ncbi:MAG: PCRF domain-containing protein, partial [Planctomycetota bacterium]
MAGKKSELAKVEKKMSSPGFWDNPDTAQSTVSRLSALKSVVEPVEQALLAVIDTQELFELAEAESDNQTLDQLVSDLAEIEKKCEQIELQGLLSGPNDANNCFFSIHAGAG